jgi:hypothetical protein
MGLHPGSGPITSLIDGSGLPAFVSGVTDYATYIGANPAHDLFSTANAWASNGILTGDLDFDLGGVYSIANLAIWSQGAISQAIKGFTVFTSADAGFAGAVNVGTFVGAQTLLAQSFALASSTGRFVRLRIDSNYGAICCTTLGEVALDVSASPVPEPATLLLLCAGLGAAGYRRRRRA